MEPPARLIPQLIATDLDGTLLDSAGAVTERTRSALRQVWLLGIDTVFVTARPPRWLNELADLVGGHGMALCGNGAYWYDVHSQLVVESSGFTPSQIRALITDLRAALPGIGFGAELGSHVQLEPRYSRLHPRIGQSDGVKLAPIEDLDRPSGKLLAQCRELPESEFLETITNVVGERGEVSYSGVTHLAEIAPPGVTKAAALKRFCAHRGVTSETVWAFGDQLNDIPMLRWAGRGIAVANAHEDVKAAADEVCPANTEDGVAQVLESLF